MGILEAYNKLVSEKALGADTAQRQVVQSLEKLTLKLQANEKQRNGIGDFLRRHKGISKDIIRGFYIWGDVGRGKTLLMDLFFENVDITHKRRVHFHEFMDELHLNITNVRQKYAQMTQNGGKIPQNVDFIGEAIKPILKTTRLLCFDEFHVSDITNAMLLGRLFEKFFEAGMVVVATSNVAPDQLYYNGLNRQLFLPFIDLLEIHCETIYLDGEKDYRLDKLIRQPVFHFGEPDELRAELDRHWEVLTGGHKTRVGSIDVLGRTIVVPGEAMGCARFDFDDLCEQPLGPRDYLAIAHAYHTLVIDGVPRFSRDNSNGAKRFIQLIDTIYDRGMKLVAGFAVEFEVLSNDKDTGFEFKRTISRLNEMASVDYLAGAANPVI